VFSRAKSLSSAILFEMSSAADSPWFLVNTFWQSIFFAVDFFVRDVFHVALRCATSRPNGRKNIYKPDNMSNASGSSGE